jgi:hypothetical protein
MPSLRFMKLHDRTKPNASSPSPSLSSEIPNKHLTPSEGFTRTEHSNDIVKPGNGLILSPSTPCTPGNRHFVLPSPSTSYSSSSGTLPSPMSPSAAEIGHGYTPRCDVRAYDSRSELSLVLGMGVGSGSSFVTNIEESEDEARAIGRVLTPEYDPFKRLEMPVSSHKKRPMSMNSEENAMDRELVMDSTALRSIDMISGHVHTNSRDTIKPFRQGWREGLRFGSGTGGKEQHDIIPYVHTLFRRIYHC